MKDVTIYFNPSCSKCRTALELLDNRGIEPAVVRYLDDNPDREALLQIIEMISDDPAELIRKDSNFKALGLNAEDYVTKEAVADFLVEHPNLMQRPIVVHGSNAVIARPPERISEVLD